MIRLFKKLFNQQDFHNERHDVDIKKDCDVTNISEVNIDFNGNIIIKSKDEDSNICANLKGKSTSKECKLDIEIRKGALYIRAQGSNSYSNNVIHVTRKGVLVYNGEIHKRNTIIKKESLDLTIYIPKKLYEYIKIVSIVGDVDVKSLEQTKYLEIKSVSGDINIHQDVCTEKIVLSTENGDISGYITSSDINVITANGDISGVLELKDDTTINAKTTNGDISYSIHNMRRNIVALRNTNGETSSNSNLTGNYELSGEIKVVNGDIKID